MLNKAASAPPRARVTASPSGSEITAVSTPSPARIFSLMLTTLSKVIKGETLTPKSKAAALA